VFAKYTLKPEINRWSQKYKRSYKHPCEDSLIESKLKTEHQNYEKKLLHHQNEMDEVSFVPEINMESRRIGENSLRANGKDGIGNIHDVLYLNSFYRQKEHEMFVTEKQKIQERDICTFKPKLISAQLDGERTLDDICNSKQLYEENMKEYQKAISKHMKTNMFKP
jgi:hypothetical protein